MFRFPSFFRNGENFNSLPFSFFVLFWHLCIFFFFFHFLLMFVFIYNAEQKKVIVYWTCVVVAET